MKLDKATIRPGIVLDVLNDGTIKASAPGLFSFTDDPSMLPPIYPWFIGSNNNAFSKLKKYDDVWIMSFSDNPQQLYWFRKDNITENANNIPMDSTDVEVICNKDSGGEWATIYFSDGTGWVIGKGDSIIQIREDGSIQLNTDMPNRCIDINGKNISIGSVGTSAHPAAYGDTVADIFNELCILLNKVATVTTNNPYTIAIGTQILMNIPKITNKISDIASQHVTID